MLDAWVEELRVDVAVHKCKVVPDEVHALSDSVSILARGLFELQSESCSAAMGVCVYIHTYVHTHHIHFISSFHHYSYFVL